MNKQNSHIMTVDVEEWFHGLNCYCKNSSKDYHFEKSMDLLFKLFDDNQVVSTLFFVGETAKKYPHILKQSLSLGHNIGSHSMSHINIQYLNEKTFRTSVEQSKKIIEDISGIQIHSYRSPFLDLNTSLFNPIDILYDVGYTIDSSIIQNTYTNPIITSNKLIRIPVTRLNLHKFSIPSGGGYLRIFPQVLIKSLINKALQHNQKLVLYIHPYDINPKHPKIPPICHKKYRRTYNLQKFHTFFDSILKICSFTSIEKHLLDRQI